MNDIIYEIKKAMKDQGLTETRAAELAGIEQSKANRMLSGKTKKLDLAAVRRLQAVLGLAANPDMTSGVTAVVQKLSDEENTLIARYRRLSEEGKKHLLDQSEFLEFRESKRGAGV